MTNFTKIAFSCAMLAACSGATFAQEQEIGDIFAAIACDDITKMESFIMQDAQSVNTPAKGDIYPLHYAVRFGRYDAAERLIKAGADVNAKTSDSQAAPMHWAAAHNKGDILKLLIASKADVNATAAKGLTALHFAVLGSSADCAKILIDAGADIAKADQQGRTALMLAEQRKNAAIIALLKPAALEAPAAAAPGIATPITPAPAAPAAEPAAPAPVDSVVDELSKMMSDNSIAMKDRLQRFRTHPGSVKLPDGSFYNGQMKGEKPEGYGIMLIDPSGRRRYEGLFKNGKKHGLGKYTYPDGSTIEGLFADDAPDGMCVYTAANGNTISGTWERGLFKTGSGTFATASGKLYEGTWENGVIKNYSPVEE